MYLENDDIKMGDIRIYNEVVFQIEFLNQAVRFVPGISL